MNFVSPTLFAKLIFVKFVPPMLMSFVFQAVARKPFNKKNMSKPKKLFDSPVTKIVNVP